MAFDSARSLYFCFGDFIFGKDAAQQGGAGVLQGLLADQAGNLEAGGGHVSGDGNEDAAAPQTPEIGGDNENNHNILNEQRTQLRRAGVPLGMLAFIHMAIGIFGLNCIKLKLSIPFVLHICLNFCQAGLGVHMAIQSVKFRFSNNLAAEELDYLTSNTTFLGFRLCSDILILVILASGLILFKNQVKLSQLDSSTQPKDPQDLFALILVTGTILFLDILSILKCYVMLGVVGCRRIMARLISFNMCTIANEAAPTPAELVDLEHLGLFVNVTSDVLQVALIFLATKDGVALNYVDVGLILASLFFTYIRVVQRINNHVINNLLLLCYAAFMCCLVYSSVLFLIGLACSFQTHP
jgi:hypothetical protein